MRTGTIKQNIYIKLSINKQYKKKYSLSNKSKENGISEYNVYQQLYIYYANNSCLLTANTLELSK